jgi:NADH-quinone oxidoreductase subunit C
MVYKKLGLYLKKILPGIEKIIIEESSCIIEVKKNWLYVILEILKTNINTYMVTLLDIWCVDFPEKEKRFQVNYLLSSLKFNFRIIIRVYVMENEGIDTVSTLYASAGWLEREVWDMFGVFFKNNNDLRRILTDYGFEGHPLRKDFPMTGFVEIRYDDTEKKIVQELLEVSQEYRVFNFKSPWEKL